MGDFEDASEQARSMVMAIADAGIGPRQPDTPVAEPDIQALRDHLACEAGALLKDLLARFPAEPEPYRLLCRLNLALGLWPQALEAARLAPHADLRAALAEDLEQAGCFEEALALIEETRPASSDGGTQFRLEYIAATALDALGREEEAIARYNRAVMLKPDCESALQRLTIYDREQGLWPQCRPRLRELERICAPRLPPTLAEGLEALLGRPAEGQALDPALAWAWERADHTRWDRQEWLAAVAWGRAAHALLVAWWRWAPDRCDQILALLEPPDLTPIRQAIAQGRGCLLVGAHVGATAVGVEFFQNSGLPFTSVGFAGTERVLERDCERRIIITANRLAVARSVRNALIAGDVLAWTVDSPVGDTVEFDFLGRPMRFVAAAPRFAARYASASFWCQTLWRGDRIVLELERLPDPVAGESEDAWTLRWYGAYLRHLERVVRGDPRNLLGQVGLWLNLHTVRRVGAAQALERYIRAAHVGPSDRGSASEGVDPWLDRAPARA